MAVTTDHLKIKNLEALHVSIEFLIRKFPNDTIILVGDMNFPGIDWQELTVKPSTPDKRTQNEFINILLEHGLHQLILEPTHILGNTLDLICTDRPDRFTYINRCN